jgi:hypothetical protein
MEVVVACSRYYLGIGVEELKISTKIMWICGVVAGIRRGSLRDMSV